MHLQSQRKAVADKKGEWHGRKSIAYTLTLSAKELVAKDEGEKMES